MKLDGKVPIFSLNIYTVWFLVLLPPCRILARGIVFVNFSNVGGGAQEDEEFIHWLGERKSGLSLLVVCQDCCRL